MLSKRNRLPKISFENVLKNGRGFRKDLIFIKVLPNVSGHNRFGFLVTKKVSKKAVIRNKVKRRLREAVRKLLPKTKKGIDVVVGALPGLENRDFWDIAATIEALFKKANLIEKQESD